MRKNAAARGILSLRLVRQQAKAYVGLRLIFAISFFAASALYSQNPPHPSFEVASIKPGGNLLAAKPDRSPGRIRWTTQVAFLIGYSYGLDFSRVSGSHLASIYTVEATFDPLATDDQVRLMLRSLLTDRFMMRSHLVTVEADVYDLCLAKGARRIKISESASADTTAWGSDNHGSMASGEESYISPTLAEAGVIAIKGRRASTAQLAEALQRSIGAPVKDQTGIAGRYDFAFRFAQDLSADPKSDTPSLVVALNENLGLTITKHKGKIDTLTVDHIEEPTAN
jgi:uncharacterized protein (TIGR03435 family)